MPWQVFIVLSCSLVLILTLPNKERGHSMTALKMTLATPHVQLIRW